MAAVPLPSLKPGRVLVRGVNWLGDAVMTTPALLRLRECFPEARITLFLPDKLQDLFDPHPSVDNVLSFARKEGLFAVSRRLRQEHFDLGVVLPNSPRSALELWLARVPLRFGYARPWRNRFLSHPVPARPGQVRMSKRSETEVRKLVSGQMKTGPAAPIPETAHQTLEYLHLMAALGANPQPVAPFLTVTDAEAQAAAQKFIPGWPGAAKPLIGLNPGAEYGPAKRWPVENFAAAARALTRRYPGALCLAFGGPADIRVGDTLGRLSGGQTTNLAGKTTLRELLSLMKLCDVVLTNDTGPMHLAAAVGTRVVVPFGSTSPELTGPGLPGDPRHTFLRVPPPCAPCFRRVCPIDLRCLTSITVDQAVDAVDQVLHAAPNRHPAGTSTR